MACGPSVGTGHDGYGRRRRRGIDYALPVPSSQFPVPSSQFPVPSADLSPRLAPEDVPINNGSTHEMFAGNQVDRSLINMVVQHRPRVDIDRRPIVTPVPAAGGNHFDLVLQSQLPDLSLIHISEPTRRTPISYA